MAILDNGIKLGTGVAVGIGALILVPTILPMVGSVVKPLAKATIKGGILLYEKGREMVAETREVFEDLVAEARAEVNAELAQAQPIAAPESTDA